MRPHSEAASLEAMTGLRCPSTWRRLGDALLQRRMGNTAVVCAILLFAAAEIPLAVLALRHWQQQQHSAKVGTANVPFILMCALFGALLFALSVRSAMSAEVSGRTLLVEEAAVKASRLSQAKALRRAQVDALLAAFDAELEGREVWPEEETCAVCLQLEESSSACCALACGHRFHKSCIGQWWLARPEDPMMCPLCRGVAAPATDERRVLALV